MKRCPKCGSKIFNATAHVTQDWLVDEHGSFLDCKNDCIEVTHFPDNDDIWDCAECGYSARGAEFEVKTDETKEKPEMEKCLKVETSAGTLKAYRNPDPGRPGICVMLQPKGYNDEIDVAFASVCENEAFATKDNETPQDVVILTYGNALKEDYTNKEVIRRADIEAGL